MNGFTIIECYFSDTIDIDNHKYFVELEVHNKKPFKINGYAQKIVSEDSFHLYYEFTELLKNSGVCEDEVRETLERHY